jgi:hypothetical protein
VSRAGLSGCSLEKYRDECSARLETRHGGDDLHGRPERRYHDKQKKQAAAYRREMAQLNSEFPLGFARDQLRAINVEIAKAVIDLHRSWLDNRKPGEHFSTFKLNSGGVN